MPTAPPTVWAGVDVGRTRHWVEVVDATGATLLSRRVSNDRTRGTPAHGVHTVHVAGGNAGDL